MPLRVSGKNISVGMALQQRITDRVEEATSKYFRGGYSGPCHRWTRRLLVFAPNACCISISGASLEAEGMAADAYESADQAAIRIEKRLRRYKRRRKDHQARRGG